ncbi:hypothetical protein BU204_20655 [Actinophytocola xanthii]|uniref:L,D-TPase catalytic domain-containing protein n=1 Tax=Actinophytocola xanthii TaxID=1912961 RepID=A0A1Q8CMU6_9PSEU|nr:hypothetical protein BU204_20655 [Actinophytocola xanthii]
MARFLVVTAAVACLASCSAEAAPGGSPRQASAPVASSPASSSPASSTAPSTTTPPPPPPPPCAANVRACVSLSSRQAWLLRGGRVEYGPVPISHGGRANPTPTGTYPVSWKDEENTSSIYGTPMPYSVFFAPGGIAFHQGDLATDSHGCVRLSMAAARAFFTSLQPGETVQVLP